MEKVLCIYHGNCADGFGAAWVVRRALGDAVEFHPGIYGEAPPDVTGRDVVMVDFSYKRDVLAPMVAEASSVLILDHHKSAQEDLADCAPAPASWQEWQAGVNAREICFGALFDMNRSGAGLAWDFFNPFNARPALINHIEDRDLWRFALPNTREIQAALFSYAYDFATWDNLMGKPVQDLVTEGICIERKHMKDLRELLPIVRRTMFIGGYEVPVANMPYTMASDAANMLADGHPFAATYYDTAVDRVFSLRSKAEYGADVSAIAAVYGGGGHKHAAGFRLAHRDLFILEKE